ncbi:MAG: cytochrome P460 family protein [Bacteroidota bacterium]
MKAPKTTLAIILFFAVFIFTLCNTDRESPVPSSVLEVKPELDAVVKYLNAQNYSASSDWFLFPGTDTSPASDTLKRLGLPVHGRWIRTYVNNIAHEYLKDAIDPEKVKAPLVFPAGSFIVKENYRSAPNATSVDKSQSALAILTILFKPDPSFEYCATSSLEAYNGTDCYGGEWFYGFYKVKDGEQMNANVQSHINAFCINCHAPAFKTDYVRTLADIRDPFTLPTDSAYCDQFTTRTHATSKVNLIKGALTEKEKKDMEKRLDAYCSPSRLSPDLPSDVPFDPNKVFMTFGSKRTQDMFNCYAWKTFIALNWANKLPEDGKPRRGEADKSVQFHGQRDQPTVWETYKPTFEVFQPNDPDWDPKDQEWNQVPRQLTGVDCVTSEDEFVLTMKSKTRDVANETGQAFAGSFGYLVDRNRNLVRYEVLFNRTEFEYLKDKGRAATKNLTPGGPKGELTSVKFPDTKKDPRKEGSIEVKSAWKELCFSDSTDCNYADAANLMEAQRKYYVRKVIIYDEDTKSCRNAYAGLIGLHIARKTHYSPQWIWMTFEHKENVPPYGKSEQANFYDPERIASDDCWKLPFLDTAHAVMNCPNVDINRFVPEFKDESNQLTRLVPVTEEAAKANAYFIGLMNEYEGSPFTNYFLVNAQWPLNGRNKHGDVTKANCSDNTLADDCFSMVPRYLRNTVVESYMSTYCSKSGKSIQLSNRSCMGCHGEAGADFSYIWLDAVSQRVNLE